jgi:hypothetical protein
MRNGWLGLADVPAARCTTPASLRWSRASRMYTAQCILSRHSGERPCSTPGAGRAEWRSSWHAVG